MNRQILPEQLNAVIVVIAIKGKPCFGKYPIRFFTRYGKNQSIQTAWSMAGASLLTIAEAEEVINRCKSKNRSAHILDLRGRA